MSEDRITIEVAVLAEGREVVAPAVMAVLRAAEAEAERQGLTVRRSGTGFERFTYPLKGAPVFLAPRYLTREKQAK